MDRTTSIAIITVLAVLLCIFIVTSSGLFVLLHRTQSAVIRTQSALDSAQTWRRFPLVPKQAPREGWDEGTVRDSFIGIKHELDNYIRKWILDGYDTAVPGDDSPSRIEGILFKPGDAPKGHNDDQDSRLFPNPREYTPDEIHSLLQNHSTREPIISHIFMSILLKAVSLDTSVNASLLPLNPTELCDLYRLRKATRGVHLWEHETHIHHYAAYHANDRNEETQSMLIDFFDSLLEPYIKDTGDSFEDSLSRRSDLRKILDGAADFGIKAFGCPYHEFKYIWGERDIHNILIYPELSTTVYEFGRIAGITKMVEAQDVPVVRSAAPVVEATVSTSAD
ncbi:hypothetical protein BKA64DRAFT_737919 [Cadophora sp. MPI-SDFR-AT-0126]|nr:hypothetical protein BKA64DRAFT_737919 [Leotiomycetes sp. MPI-SDFR-AT-0126]